MSHSLRDVTWLPHEDYFEDFSWDFHHNHKGQGLRQQNNGMGRDAARNTGQPCCRRTCEWTFPTSASNGFSPQDEASALSMPYFNERPMGVSLSFSVPCEEDS